MTNTANQHSEQLIARAHRLMTAVIVAIALSTGCTTQAKWVTHDLNNVTPLISRLRGLAFDVVKTSNSENKRTTTIRIEDLARYGTYQHSVDPSFDYDILVDHQAYLSNQMPGFVFGNSFYNSAENQVCEDGQSAPCIGCVVSNNKITHFLFVIQYSRFAHTTFFRVDDFKYQPVPTTMSFALLPIKLKQPSPTTIEYSQASHSTPYNYMLLPASLDFVMKPAAKFDSAWPNSLLSSDNNLQFYYVIDLNRVQCEL